MEVYKARWAVFLKAIHFARKYRSWIIGFWSLYRYKLYTVDSMGKCKVDDIRSGLLHMQGPIRQRFLMVKKGLHRKVNAVEYLSRFLLPPTTFPSFNHRSSIFKIWGLCILVCVIIQRINLRLHEWNIPFLCSWMWLLTPVQKWSILGFILHCFYIL